MGASEKCRKNPSCPKKVDEECDVSCTVRRGKPAQGDMSLYKSREARKDKTGLADISNNAAVQDRGSDCRMGS